MRRIRPRRPSPAMLVATLALIVALSGTAFAGPIAHLARLVNGDKLIKQGSLSGNRLRKHTLTGTQVNLSKLGTVPKADKANNATNATHATNADTTQNLAAPEAFREVGAPGEPAFQNSWQDKNGPSGPRETVGFYKDHEGVVHLKGAAAGGTSNNVIFQLPPGYRPASGKLLDVAAACECTGAQTTTLTISGVDGAVLMLNGTLTGVLWFDGVTFRAAS